MESLLVLESACFKPAEVLTAAGYGDNFLDLFPCDIEIGDWFCAKQL